MRLIVTTLLLATSFVAAEARCSKASLNGNWAYTIAGGNGTAATASNGIIDLGGGEVIIVRSFGTKCMGQVTFERNGNPVAFGTIVSEKVSRRSAKKPNLLFVNLSYTLVYLVLRLQRRP